MDIINELLCQEVGRRMIESFKAVEIDYDKIVQTKALTVLEKIKRIIRNDRLDDFMKVDEIVNVFSQYNIDTGGCHDF